MRVIRGMPSIDLHKEGSLKKNIDETKPEDICTLLRVLKCLVFLNPYDNVRVIGVGVTSIHVAMVTG